MTVKEQRRELQRLERLTNPCRLATMTDEEADEVLALAQKVGSDAGRALALLTPSKASH